MDDPFFGLAKQLAEHEVGVFIELAAKLRQRLPADRMWTEDEVREAFEQLLEDDADFSAVVDRLKAFAQFRRSDTGGGEGGPDAA